MVWQLVSHDVALGTTGPELPSPGPTARAWPLLPTSAFDSIRPLLAAMAELQRSPGEGVPGEVLAIVDDGERARAIQSWIAGNPRVRRGMDVYAQFNALALQLVSEGGVPLAAWSILIAELPPSDLPFVPKMRDDFVEAGFADGPPFYMVVASLEEPEFLRRTVRAVDDVPEHPPNGPA